MKNLTVFCKKVLVSLCFFSAGFFAFSVEYFRVAKTHVLPLPQDYSEVTVNSGIADALAIKLPQDTTFITGIELNIKVPQVVAQWRDSIAYIFYKNANPEPDEKKIDYSADKISVYTIPGKLSHTVYIPLNEKFNIKSNPYARIIDERITPTENTVFLRFMLAMKGAPEELETAQFTITAKPVLSDEGYFSLNVKKPEGKTGSYSVYIDDELILTEPVKLVLKKGEHHLTVTGEEYRNEIRTFIVEQAKSAKLSVELRGIEPSVKIVSPQNASIYFDGKLLENAKEPFVIAPGNHSVKFVIGDYEITKNLNAINGRSYTVNLNIDASISEEE